MSDDFYHDDPIEKKSSGIFNNKFLTSFVVVIAAAFFFQSTLAANLSINSSQSVEFGQGIAVTTVCDSTVTLTPYSSFVNGSSSGTFYFSAFQLSNIDAAACSGVTFTLKAYDNSSSSPLTLFSTNTSASITDNNSSFEVAANQSGLSLADSQTAGSFTASFASPAALSSDIYKITVESSGNGSSSISTVTVSAFNFTSISVGREITCAITFEDKLYCWGINNVGQLGNGQTGSGSSYPVEVSSLTDVMSVAVDSGSGACATLLDSSVYCWGDSGNGRIGDGRNGDGLGNNSSVPIKVELGSTAWTVSAGGGTPCALMSDKTVKCWGYNFWGTVGNGTDQSNGTSSVLSPVVVTGLSDVVRVDSGGSTTCALINTGGTVYCWGYGTPGTLGDGVDHSGNFCWNGTTPVCSVRTPVQVTGLTNAREITVGDNHACALMMDRTVQCWGSNTSFKLGKQTAPDSCNKNTETCARSPGLVSGLTSVQQISAGGNTTCALKTDGLIFCWGAYGSGNLGTNASADSYTPIEIAGISNASKVAVGDSYVCAILATGTVKCWGSNTNGQFGNGTKTSSATPS